MSRIVETLVVTVSVTLLALAALWVDPRLYWQGDMQMQYLPVCIDVARAVASADSPFVSPWSWFGGAHAGEWQPGVFSPVHLPLMAVACRGGSPASAAAALVIPYLAVLATGAWHLARSYGIGRGAAALAAITTTTNGFMLYWAAPSFLPALASFAWVPWFAVAVRRGLTGSLRGQLAAGVLASFVVAVGWPYSVGMAGLLTLLLVRAAVAEGHGRHVVGALVRVTLFAGALSAPVWMSLLEYFPTAARGGMSGPNPSWRVPLDALPGFVLPGWSGTWHAFRGVIEPRASVELACGAVAPLALLHALVTRPDLRRRHESLVVALGAALVLAMLPGWGTLRWPFRWLPLIFLLIGVLGAAGLDAAYRAGRPSAGRDPAVVGGGILVLLGLVGSQSASGLPDVAWWSAGLGLAWALGARALPASWGAGVGAVVALALSATLLVHHPREPLVRSWDLPTTLHDPAPLDPTRLHLSLFTVADTDDQLGRTDAGWGGVVRPGSTSLHTPIPALHGYSPMLPGGLHAAFGFGAHGLTDAEHAAQVLSDDTGPGALLDRLGVDALVVSAHLRDALDPAVPAGWTPTDHTPEASVWHRDTRSDGPLTAVSSVRVVHDAGALFEDLQASPRSPRPRLLDEERHAGVLNDLAPVGVSGVRASRARIEARVRAPDGEALLLVRRAWYPGWRAWLDGEALDVHGVDAMQPAVSIPAGTDATLVVAYRPLGVRYGLWVAALAALAAGVLAAGAGRSEVIS